MNHFDLAKKKLDKIAKQIGYRKLQYNVLSRILNKEFKSMRVKFSFLSSTTGLGEFVIMNGWYNGCSDDDGYRYEIEITKDNNQKYIKPRKHGFFEELYFVLMHELRHGYQDRSRKYKAIHDHCSARIPRDLDADTARTLQYHSMNDEIDAYAFETAEAIRMGKKDYWIIDRYRKIGTHLPDVYNRFLKKVYLFSNK